MDTRNPNPKKLKRLRGGKKWNGIVVYNSMSALLHNDEMVYSIFFSQDVEMANNNMYGLDAQGFP